MPNRSERCRVVDRSPGVGIIFSGVSRRHCSRYSTLSRLAVPPALYRSSPRGSRGPGACGQAIGCANGLATDVPSHRRIQRKSRRSTPSKTKHLLPKGQSERGLQRVAGGARRGVARCPRGSPARCAPPPPAEAAEGNVGPKRLGTKGAKELF